ncbi:endonuclease/exonuclease/phosphatase family protein [Clostridium nigeriense]|uniref:endonuclease/exonuclease/phosphatase family protein n=1 Tax=Clostridium nigeriense TaxID=1805470 RepID=UPI003D355279
MKVMTFNLRTDFPLDINNRWDKRKEIVYELIKNNDFDIIGVQELNNKMFNDLTSEIFNYNFVGMPRSSKFFIERNDILVSNRHRIIEYNTFWLSKNPEKIGSSVWYSVFPRICTTALIELEDGNIVRVYNTHLDFLLPKAREYGLKKIGEYIENQHEKDDYPAILMGDFNSSPNSKVIRNLSEGKYSSKKFIAVQDSKKEIYSLSTLSKFKGSRKGLHIDYIFVTEEFDVKNSEIIYYNIDGRYPSDHYPISAELKIKDRLV